MNLSLFLLFLFQTDGKGVYGCKLSDEYRTAAQGFSLDKQFLKQHVISTLDYIFESENVKEKLRLKFQNLVSLL